MNEIEKMKRYIAKSHVPTSPRYDAAFRELAALADGMDLIVALDLAFRYGKAKGCRAARAEARKA